MQDYLDDDQSSSDSAQGCRKWCWNDCMGDGTKNVEFPEVSLFTVFVFWTIVYESKSQDICSVLEGS